MIKKPAFPILLGILALVCLCAAWQPAQASPAAVPFFLKIMAFGDSITSSIGDGGCIVPKTGGPAIIPQASYRYYLDKDLHAANIPFIFIGKVTENWCGQPLHAGQFDQHNEGHSGYTALNFLNPNDAQGNYIDTILNSVSSGTTIPNVPDIVLMHLGTNELAQGFQISETINHLSILIDHFRAKNPNVAILLAQIIPCAPTTHYVNPPVRTYCAQIPALNAAMPALVAQKNTAASPVVLVDQYTGFSASTTGPNADTYDGLHPQKNGEIKMADKWLAAIQKLYSFVPKRTFFPVVLK